MKTTYRALTIIEASEIGVEHSEIGDMFPRSFGLGRPGSLESVP